MATKKIRLTESELTNLIRRIVEDTENTMDMEPEMSKNEVLELISDFFKDEVLPELSPRETRSLKQKLERPQPRGIREDEEGHNSLSDRTSSFKEKLMMRGGLGMAGVGAIAALGEFTGWSEHELTSKIHEFVEMAGAGNYSGPITVAMVAAGLAMALRGRAKQYSRTGE